MTLSLSDSPIGIIVPAKLIRLRTKTSRGNCTTISS
jgi:hypothetical protein